ncbi:MAG: hypothetical protein IPG43_02830 [Proteobacteria bacterium]|nr:hypothetical protein [Pseudomonadota bacterium]
MTVHPIHLRGLLGANPAVLQYQVDCDGEAMDVAVVLAAGAPVDTRRTLEQGLANALATRGAQPVLQCAWSPSSHASRAPASSNWCACTRGRPDDKSTGAAEVRGRHEL